MKLTNSPGFVLGSFFLCPPEKGVFLALEPGISELQRYAFDFYWMTYNCSPFDHHQQEQQYWPSSFPGLCSAANAV